MKSNNFILPAQGLGTGSMEVCDPLWLAFTDAAHRFPKAVAVQHEGASLTYEELYRLSLRIKRYLRVAGVAPGARVAIKMPKGIPLLAHILATWAHSTSLLLLEENISPEELARKLEKSRVTWLLGDHHGDIPCTGIHTVPSFRLDTDVADVETPDSGDEAFTVGIDPLEAVSILFTSGTTGMSKCVALPHEGLLRIVWGLIDHYALTIQRRLGWTASLSFDSAIAEPLLALLSGATLVIPGQDRHLVGAALEGFIAQERITHLIITPSVLDTANPDNVPEHIMLVLVGEPVSERTVKRWWKNRILYNAYGPSEASICATVSSRLMPGELISVGKPLPDVRIEIIGDGNRLLPMGAIGEVAIGGVGVSTGYLDDPTATAKAFIRLHPEGELFHLTGDIGFIGNHGNLFLCGRKDQQVKINGRRVDLGEIERALCKHDSVVQACASKIDLEDAGHRLAAFIKFDRDRSLPSVEQLREHMAALLPSFAIPSAWYVVDSLPTTVNGKLNRKTLSKHVSFELARGDYLAPEGDLEIQVSKVFENVLKVENIGRHDSFFVLGGSSLDTIRLVDRLRRDFSVGIGYEDFIKSPTVHGVAELVQSGALINKKMAQLPSPSLSADSYRTVAASTQFPENVLITGSTGFFGKTILEALLSNTHARIVCATRHRSRPQLIATLLEYPALAERWSSKWDERLSSIYFDLEGNENHQLAQAISDADLVIHCAANVNLAYDFASLYKANVLSTLNILEYCSLGRPKRFILVSSRSAVDPNDDSGYGETKRMAESVVQEAFARGLGGTIVRPGRITGHTELTYINHNDFIIRCIRACLLLGLYPAGLDVFGGVPVNDLADDMANACWRADSENGVIDVADSDFYRFVEIFDLTAAAGYAVRRVSIGHWLEKAFEQGLMARFPDVVMGFEKSWNQISLSCSMRNYRFPEGGTHRRAERTQHLVASILNGMQQIA